MSLFKKYVPIEGNDENFKLKMTISFHKGGRTYTGVEVPAGYRGHILPVKIERGDGYTTETSGSFTGFNINLINAGRQSAKRLQAAIDLMNEKSQYYYDHWKEHYAKEYFETEIVEG